MPKKAKKKTLVSNKYIDRVVGYLSELEDKAGEGVEPDDCGMCEAMRIDIPLYGICGTCPLYDPNGEKYCGAREKHLRTVHRMKTRNYSMATKESTLKRVRWIAKQVNTYTYNKDGWVIHTK